ncbi:MAG: ATP-binding cassette domain-containing protein [Anaerolineae bacterium]|jgi:ATP-binding cassette subfamily F protein 3|nr:ATP-binding cassette domain-containing protein [Anaerolineae bacterium]
MSLIRLNNIHKTFGEAPDKPVPVLREVYFRLDQGDRVGLIGKNGAGKTTLLKLILGLETPTEGTIDVDAGVRIGYFSQFSQLDGTLSILEVLDDVFAEIHALEEAMLEVEIAFEENPGGAALDRLIAHQSTLIEAMEHSGAWTYQYKIDTALSRLGFSEAHRTCPIDSLSGGWRNRAALAKILLEGPDILLMDEPTNFLDVEGLAWLEGWFSDFPGALIFVTHDRQFLDRVANRIVEVEAYHVQEYAGNYRDYVREKPTRLKSLERLYEHEAELLLYEAEAIADREEARRNPSRALQRKLANIRKQADPRPVDKIITSIYDRLYVPNDILTVEMLGKAYGDQVLFRDLTFGVYRGDRVAILGPNGCGKTTLLKVLSELVPADSGHLTWGKGVGYAYYNQIFEELDLDDTVSHAVNIVGLAYIAPRKQVNRFLSMMQFSEMDLAQKIRTLSGGQRARVALAKCLLSGAGLVILDEPTNHLDMTSTQVMERALAHFPGAVIVVSHDRFFIDKVATKLLIFEEPAQVREISGNWTTWQAGNRV